MSINIKKLWNKNTNKNMDVKEVLEEFGDNLIADIRYNMANYDMSKGNLAKSLEYETDGTNFKLYANDYWNYAQHGRGPGPVPHDFEEILENWITENGIKPQTNITQFANAIKYKTIREGSSIYRGDRPERDFIGDAIDINLEELEKSLRSISTIII